jgi:hypothetical protein
VRPRPVAGSARRCDSWSDGTAGECIGGLWHRPLRSGGLPDVTYKADGPPHALPEIQASFGVVGHPTPKLDLFGFAGIEAEKRKFGGTGANAYGYGYRNPNSVKSGCNTISAGAT